MYLYGYCLAYWHLYGYGLALLVLIWLWPSLLVLIWLWPSLLVHCNSCPMKCELFVTPSTRKD